MENKLNVSDIRKNFFQSYYGSGRCQFGPETKKKREHQFLKDLNRNTTTFVPYSNHFELLRDMLGLPENLDEVELTSLYPVIKDRLKNIFKNTQFASDADKLYLEFISNWHQGGAADYLGAKLFHLFWMNKSNLSNKVEILYTPTEKKITPTEYGLLVHDKISLQALSPELELRENLAALQSDYAIFFNDLKKFKIIPLTQNHTKQTTNKALQKHFTILDALDFDIIKDLPLLSESDCVHQYDTENYRNMAIFLSNLKKYAENSKNQDLIDILPEYRLELAKIINTQNHAILNNTIFETYQKIEPILNNITSPKFDFNLFNRAESLSGLKNALIQNKAKISQHVFTPKH